jgi:hypothetical protein
MTEILTVAARASAGPSEHTFASTHPFAKPAARRERLREKKQERNNG